MHITTGEHATSAEKLTVGQRATLACLLEATIPKPGNVHRGADFEDLTFTDFVAAGVAIGPAMQRASEGAALGTTVLEAIRATRAIAATNVNLGIVLLLAPLACASQAVDLRQGVADVLSRLTPADCADVYEAIRLATPGGLGRVDDADVAGPPPSDLLHAMRLAAERDTIARQYVTGFAELFDFVVPDLRAGLARGWSLGDAVIRTHLRTMQAIPDSLIARKCGSAVAGEVAVNAGAVLNVGEPDDENYLEALADFDFWLRSDGHRRNPGTTADLLAAALFMVLSEGSVPLPLKC
ncbi:MAG: triphosphoribosyl-dephospho-CoA synthase [Planctomycetia bacterium]|nr:triphosphoribosyl-dephospho-CoA synthase [Planctomycetia bacterium]